MDDSDRDDRDIPSLLVELSEQADEEEHTLPELVSQSDSEITVKERPKHLTKRIARQEAPSDLDSDKYVWLEWDEFLDSDATFPHFHAIGEDGCGRENVAPCVLTTRDRATEAWFLAEECPFCFGEGTIRHVEETEGEVGTWTE